MNVSEADIERRGAATAKRRGWASYKFTSPSRRNVPDRILMRDGVAFFIEYKAPGKTASPAQEREHHKLRANGFRVFVVDSLHGTDEALDRVEAVNADA